MVGGFLINVCKPQAFCVLVGHLQFTLFGKFKLRESFKKSLGSLEPSKNKKAHISFLLWFSVGEHLCH